MDAPTDSSQPSQRQTLGLTFAESRAPETPILGPEGLTKNEALSLVDLARYWARIGKTEFSFQEHPSTSECLPIFLKAVFDEWDSTEGAPSVPRKLENRKEEDKGLIVGTWEEDLPPSLVETDDAEAPQKKKPSARKRGADAWLTLVLDENSAYDYGFLDESSRISIGRHNHPRSLCGAAELPKLLLDDDDSFDPYFRTME
ncbi:hypothetical protein LCI18_007053 [Fusarium solani-melongenae]|uniref:Uncharacterized protein n=1 Tax=Fusarium solani subsp. cucurbitae TaxID=2747967 RepID=A0ACD3Z4W5_FUSSC|nr:hypothetical protein LCI18_007053 [Fusarium solani-melongenae]